MVEVPLTAVWKAALPLGCHPVDCHYVEDNLRVPSRADAMSLMFRLEPERCLLQWVSPSEGPYFAKWSQKWWNKPVQTRLERSRNRFMGDENQALIIQLR